MLVLAVALGGVVGLGLGTALVMAMIDRDRDGSISPFAWFNCVVSMVALGVLIRLVAS